VPEENKPTVPGELVWVWHRRDCSWKIPKSS